MTSRKTALITGASSGFGRVTAEMLAREGHVVFASMRGVAGKNERAAEQLRAWAERERATLHVLELDVTDDASVEAAVGGVLEREGRLDVLISNAGSMASGLAETITPEDLRALFEVNVVGPQRMMRAVLPAMRKEGAGLAVHVTSAFGRLALPCVGAYCASKFALEALCEAYHYELGPLGVDVAIVEPGAYPTETAQKALPASDAARAAHYGAQAELPAKLFGPLGAKLGAEDAPRPEEVARAIARLLAMAPGARPLRTIVGSLLTNGVAAINAATDAAEAELFAAMGATSLVWPNPRG